MKYVFEQVMLVDGTRKMRGDIIQKTLKAAEFLIKFIIKSRALYEEWATDVYSHAIYSAMIMPPFTEVVKAKEVKLLTTAFTIYY